ncbi:efflux RND transporter periplasmic adaptor subunit [Acetobacteraceae bacterium H6797]|nr:efflux RND transporter periplasmic adaptor subunit [Acetobacteraceae bacterium H6797]
MNMISPPDVPTEARATTSPGEAKPVGTRRRRLMITTCLALAAIGVSAGAVALYRRSSDHAIPLSLVTPAQAATTNGKLGDGSFRLTPAEMRLLRVEPVATRDFRPERIAEGRISYNEHRSTPVFAPFTGRVLRVVAQPGQEVRAGDTLFEIETTDLTQAANDLLSAVDGLTKARAQLELTRRNEARQRDLFAAKAAARRDLEQAQADFAGATADLRTAEATLAAARDKLRVLGRDAATIAQIEQTRRVDAVVAVTAPLAGTVVQRRIGPNQWLTSGSGDPVFTIADLSEMWLVAGVREMDAPLVQPGQPVEVSVDALPGRVFAARIENVGAALEPTTRRLAIRAAVQDPDHVLKPEMFASFRIGVGEAKQAVAVPASALIHRGADVSLWEALDGNRFALRQVKTGLQSGELVQVTDGLAPGARVVTGGALFIDRAAQD